MQPNIINSSLAESHDVEVESSSPDRKNPIRTTKRRENFKSTRKRSDFIKTKSLKRGENKTNKSDINLKNKLQPKVPKQNSLTPVHQPNPNTTISILGKGGRGREGNNPLKLKQIFPKLLPTKTVIKFTPLNAHTTRAQTSLAYRRFKRPILNSPGRRCGRFESRFTDQQCKHGGSPLSDNKPLQKYDVGY
ncbi:hypothetical protein CEXT_19441 [Caerostris extrusa]|uniref:Uncharacterized protein n=1 Tax=Caerostris extrusa TaxID=172846 RepID=A0AAV4Y605_CAEEX|nr:hypothetical protein CEXT_19441 [Caerostris extrusa]